MNVINVERRARSDSPPESVCISPFNKTRPSETNCEQHSVKPVVPKLFKLMPPTTMADLCSGPPRVQWALTTRADLYSGPPRVDMIDDSVNDQNFII